MSERVQELVVLGAGGHARVLVDLILRSGEFKPLAVLDRDPSLAGQNVQGIPIVGGDEALDRYAPDQVRLVNGIGSVRDTGARQALYARCHDRGFQFQTLVHPTATVAAGAVLGEGAQVMAGAVINTGASIGEDCIVNTGAVVEHDCSVGAHAHVATGAVLAGGVNLGTGVHVGAGATVIQGVTVGDRTVVGAGAVVVGNLGGDVVAVGVPARVREARG